MIGLRSHRRTLPLSDRVGVRLDVHRASRTFKPYRSDAWWLIRACGWLGLQHPVTRAICNAEAVFDLSGGDSFSDIYGMHRFLSVYMPKRMAMEHNRPLVLLPQTYGPFDSREAGELARRAVRGAAAAWARDPVSFAVLQELLGDAFDPRRHRLGVDLAFGLPGRDPMPWLEPTVRAWFESPDAGPVVGVNVSGLARNAGRQEALGLTPDYDEMLGRLTQSLLDDGARVLLVPHTIALTKHGAPECDLEGCLAIKAMFGRDTVQVLKSSLDAAQIKGVIARLDWFCGARMHSAIAALSSGVPVVGLAYSPKIEGVFGLCGLGDSVGDLRTTDAFELADWIYSRYQERASARAVLAEHLPKVMHVLEAQLDAIAEPLMSEPKP